MGKCGRFLPKPMISDGSLYSHTPQTPASLWGSIIDTSNSKDPLFPVSTHCPVTMTILPVLFFLTFPRHVGPGLIYYLFCLPASRQGLD